jgi:uncharacterized protein (TIGR02646 family)
MRYIPLDTPPPDAEYAEWLKKANELLDELKAAPDEEARHAIIDKNSEFWGKLKNWLLSLSDGRCWFSEAEDCFNYWHVEHFRPKKDCRELDGTKHSGYWWLAFDWTNFRICGSVGNSKKGTYFPLKDEAKRAQSPDDEVRYEAPLLLDPANPHDPDLIFFNMEGRAIPDPNIVDDWERTRVTYSIERCNLDYPGLMNKRKLVWSNCWKLIQDYRKELEKLYASNHDNDVARYAVAEKAAEIKKLIKGNLELSAVARACVLSTGDTRVTHLLKSA